MHVNKSVLQELEFHVMDEKLAGVGGGMPTAGVQENSAKSIAMKSGTQ